MSFKVSLPTGTLECGDNVSYQIITGGVLVLQDGDGGLRFLSPDKWYEVVSSQGHAPKKILRLGE